MDTKFSVAIHILVMISESKKDLSSQDLANSVGTNSSYIRKVISLLKNANLIVSRQGKIGYQLTKKAIDITLLDIYYATQEIKKISLFQIHQNTNEHCPVGFHIEGLLTPIFNEMENKLEKELSEKNLAMIINNLYLQAKLIKK
ncbi:Rrf2 family transcriptional regulator [Gemella cuniculi]|uniref:Rrf2 family transcriptional regulator n=1 Tax=Gemella cuniculi TaxID=150240 RepID=UPI000428C5D8|nr:Rrf2 family transcriptional regulator [Gemella cuniculi]